MKFELTEHKRLSDDTYEGEKFDIYITRNNFIKGCEEDVIRFVHMLQEVIEMYLMRHCIKNTLSREEIGDIYRYFLEHKTVKGVGFQITGDTDGIGLVTYFVK